MDAKDLRTDTSQRSNDGSSKFTHSVSALPCNTNKTYDTISSNPLAKGETPTSRPCAVIGPDRIVHPPPAGDVYLKKGHYDPWPPMETTYRQPPEYPHKMPTYLSPLGNISPRQTFQENMPRIMVQPTYNSKVKDDANYASDRNLSKASKINGLAEPKYCDVPYSVNPMNDQKSSEMCVPNVNNSRNYPQMWHPAGVNMRPSRAYGASEMYQYPEYPSCAGSRPAPMTRPHRAINEDPGHPYSDPYYHESNVRFKPYPNIKERYPQARYEYVSNYTNPFHPPHPFPPYKYDIQKPLPPHPTHAQVPIKYVDNRMTDSVMDGYQRPPQGSYTAPYRNQVIHPTYGPMLGNNLPNKLYPYTEGPGKPVATNKLPYDNKLYVDYETARNKGFPMSESFYDMRQHMKSQVIVPNFPPASMQPMHPHLYYRKENIASKNFEYISHLRHLDPSFNPTSLTKLSSQFSPTSIAISPADSNTSNDTAHTQGGSLEDCGYVSQSSTASHRSIDSGVGRIMHNDFHRRYNHAYASTVRTSPLTSKSEIIGNANKNKKGIDVRQFLQMWNEGDEENASNPKEVITQPDYNANKQQSQYEIAKNNEQLYVLGLMNVPSEELGKYEHIQKVSKLPENIKGYNNIELLKHFEEAIESSNLNQKQSIPRNYPSPVKNPLLHALPPRPLSPLDVEAKISQSVIHKEVGCNFEIKPCSPEMLNVQVATPAQNILNERTIEKVTNPLIIKSPMMSVGNGNPPLMSSGNGNDSICNVMKPNDHTLLLNANNKIPSCKMINTQCSNSDATNIVKANYSLQDLESNAGVCLASLPRLDNDIELNFPEVNQQFINANKESVITTVDLNVKPNNDHFEQSGEDSENITKVSVTTESDKEFCKLSKYRKIKKNDGVSIGQPLKMNYQSLRTDSVIIKNPENTKSVEHIIDNYLIKKDDDNFDLAIGSNSHLLEADFKNKQGDISNEMALDFSLSKIDNSNIDNSSPKDTSQKLCTNKQLSENTTCIRDVAMDRDSVNSGTLHLQDISRSTCESSITNPENYSNNENETRKSAPHINECIIDESLNKNIALPSILSPIISPKEYTMRENNDRRKSATHNSNNVLNKIENPRSASPSMPDKSPNKAASSPVSGNIHDAKEDSNRILPNDSSMIILEPNIIKVNSGSHIPENVELKINDTPTNCVSTGNPDEYSIKKNDVSSVTYISKNINESRPNNTPSISTSPNNPKECNILTSVSPDAENDIVLKLDETPSIGQLTVSQEKYPIQQNDATSATHVFPSDFNDEIQNNTKSYKISSISEASPVEENGITENMCEIHVADIVDGEQDNPSSNISPIKTLEKHETKESNEIQVPISSISIKHFDCKLNDNTSTSVSPIISEEYTIRDNNGSRVSDTSILDNDFNCKQNSTSTNASSNNSADEHLTKENNTSHVSVTHIDENEIDNKQNNTTLTNKLPIVTPDKNSIEKDNFEEIITSRNSENFTENFDKNQIHSNTLTTNCVQSIETNINNEVDSSITQNNNRSKDEEDTVDMKIECKNVGIPVVDESNRIPLILTTSEGVIDPNFVVCDNKINDKIESQLTYLFSPEDDKKSEDNYLRKDDHEFDVCQNNFAAENIATSPKQFDGSGINANVQSKSINKLHTNEITLLKSLSLTDDSHATLDNDCIALNVNKNSSKNDKTKNNEDENMSCDALIKTPYDNTDYYRKKFSFSSNTDHVILEATEGFKTDIDLHKNQKYYVKSHDVCMDQGYLEQEKNSSHKEKESIANCDTDYPNISENEIINPSIASPNLNLTLLESFSTNTNNVEMEFFENSTVLDYNLNEGKLNTKDFNQTRINATTNDFGESSYTNGKIKVAPTKEINLKKELFSPWIQKLVLRNEGKCVNNTISGPQLDTSETNEEVSSNLDIRNNNPEDRLKAINNENELKQQVDSRDTIHLNVLSSRTIIKESCKEHYFVDTTESSSNYIYKKDVPTDVYDHVDNVSVADVTITADSEIHEIETETSIGENIALIDENEESLPSHVPNNVDTEDSMEGSLNQIHAISPTQTEEQSNKDHIPLKRALKRSLSDSALNIYKNDSDENVAIGLQQESSWRPQKIKKSNNAFLNVFNIHNRRNSISSVYNDENMSFCILIGNNCIISEENEEEEKICYDISEQCFTAIHSDAVNENEMESTNEIILCPQNDSDEYVEPLILEVSDEKSFEESWVDDVACVETVVSDDIAEDIVISAPSSPRDIDESDSDESNIFNCNTEHTEKVKYIYGDKMCNDDAELVETLYRTPQMDVNRTLINREPHSSDDCDNYVDDPDEDIVPETLGIKTNNPEEVCIPDADFNNIVNDDSHNNVTLHHSPSPDPIRESNLVEIGNNCANILPEKTQDDNINSCESSIDDALFCSKQEENSIKHIDFSSPEVSSTTTEEKNSTILLKITNYKGTRVSHLADNSVGRSNNSCRFTENVNYGSYQSDSTKPRPLITKAAQKYIPPPKDTVVDDLKVKLPLPRHSLMKYKQLKISRNERHCNAIPKKDFQKKLKPKFEDVLKSIDELQFKKHKEKIKKPKKSVPKVVIKKTENGSHYASTPTKESYNPDLTGRKWQPWVFIEKNIFIDKMAIRKKTKAVYNHRNNTYVFAENFKKYKSIANSKFVISQPKLDDSSSGQFKYTIRLKHSY